jgi:hypothetical protein
MIFTLHDLRPETESINQLAIAPRFRASRKKSSECGRRLQIGVGTLGGRERNDKPGAHTALVDDLLQFVPEKEPDAGLHALSKQPAVTTISR